jgi:hypothetical protein
MAGIMNERKRGKGERKKSEGKKKLKEKIENREQRRTREGKVRGVRKGKEVRKGI